MNKRTHQKEGVSQICSLLSGLSALRLAWLQLIHSNTAVHVAGSQSPVSCAGDCCQWTCSLSCCKQQCGQTAANWLWAACDALNPSHSWWKWPSEQRASSKPAESIYENMLGLNPGLLDPTYAIPWIRQLQSYLHCHIIGNMSNIRGQGKYKAMFASDNESNP